MWCTAGYIGDLAAKRFPNVARPAIIQLSLVLAAPVRAHLAPQTLPHPWTGVLSALLGAARWHPRACGAVCACAHVRTPELCCCQLALANADSAL